MHLPCDRSLLKKNLVSFVEKGVYFVFVDKLTPNYFSAVKDRTIGVCDTKVKRFLWNWTVLASPPPVNDHHADQREQSNLTRAFHHNFSQSHPYSQR